jgi:tetratricopeptide (TPR) repeat protein
MRHLGAMLALCLVGFLSQPGAADQNDPRLEELFTRLHEAPDPHAAQGIELVIWELWISHPDDTVNAMMDEGRAAMAQRDYVAALETFERMVDVAPEFAEGWNKRATIHWILGNYQTSLDDIDRTLALEPRHFGALSGRGLVYSAMEEWDLAIESFEEALVVNPQMTGPRVNAEAIRRMLKDREI